MARTFGTLFSYDSRKCAHNSDAGIVITYYRVQLLKEWMNLPTGTYFYRIDMDADNGDVYFFLDDEYVVSSGTF
jgi:hypothetical protein